MSSETTFYCHHQSPLGDLLLGGLGGRLDFLRFSSNQKVLGDLALRKDWIDDKTPYLEALRELDAYFSGELKTFTVSYHLSGTDFQKSVWAELEKIPFGALKSYGDIAHALQNPGASRAVGMANNANPLPIIVPCHRVIGADGSLVGFGGGMETKIWLLEHEGINPSQIHNPDQMSLAL